MSGRLAIVDAHHHVWDPDANYHPWLRDKPVSGFRYGDYAPIRRRYLVPDYLADARNYHVAGSVYVEAEWDPDDPIGEMEYIAAVRRESGYPSVAVAQIWLDRHDAAQTLERHADFDFVRSVRQKPRANASPADRVPGGMADRRWREGFAQLRSRGLRFDLQTPWWHLHEAAALACDFPDTQIIVNHTGLPADRSADGLAAWRAVGARAEARVDLRLDHREPLRRPRAQILIGLLEREAIEQFPGRIRHVEKRRAVGVSEIAPIRTHLEEVRRRVPPGERRAADHAVRR